MPESAGAAERERDARRRRWKNTKLTPPVCGSPVSSTRISQKIFTLFAPFWRGRSALVTHTAARPSRDDGGATPAGATRPVPRGRRGGRRRLRGPQGLDGVDVQALHEDVSSRALTTALELVRDELRRASRAANDAAWAPLGLHARAQVRVLQLVARARLAECRGFRAGDGVARGAKRRAEFRAEEEKDENAPPLSRASPPRRTRVGSTRGARTRLWPRWWPPRHDRRARSWKMTPWTA